MDLGLNLFELSKGWIPSLWKQLLEIRTAREKELNELADVFGDPLLLARYYIEPDCQQLNPVDYSEDASIVREPLFSRIQTFISGDPLRKDNQLFILSDAGMGKTSALLMLKLSHMLSFWPRGYDCRLLKIGADTLTAINAIENKRETVLLLDALDEDPLAWNNVESRLGDLLRASRPFLRVIFTCRTQFFQAGHDPFARRGQVEVSGFIASVVYASLFTDHQVVRYIEKRFPDKVNDSEWLTRTKGIVNGMGFLRMRPMLLAHLEDLMESSKVLWNEYSIYKALVDSWLLREQRKVCIANSEHSIRLRKACRYAAFTMQQSQRRYFTKTETELLDKVANSDGGTKIDLGGRSLLNKDSHGNFRFSHYSVQEFLALEYILASTEFAIGVEIRTTDLMRKMAVAWLLQASPADRNCRNFQSIDYSGVCFDDVDLSGTNFTKCRLRNATFRGTNLAHANLSKGYFEGTMFSKANLEGVNATFSNLSNCTFDHADLSGANFGSANLRGTHFNKCNVEGLTATGSHYNSATSWHEMEGFDKFGAQRDTTNSG